MPGPTLRPNGVYQINVRVPADLAAIVAGTAIELPIGPGVATVRASDKVMASLRTKDRREAKTRFTTAHGALVAHFQALRAKPATSGPTRDAPAGPGFAPNPEAAGVVLGHKQAVALAGELYKECFDAQVEAFDLDAILAADREFEESVRAWMAGEPGDRPLSREDAERLAILSQPHGPQILAWRRRADVVDPCLGEPMRLADALEDLFGYLADRVCAPHGLKLAPYSRLHLPTHIANTIGLGAARLERVARGDYSPDSNLARFPSFDQATVVTVNILFERWRDANKARIEASTIRRYTPSLASLATFLGAKDIRRVTQDDIWDWAEHRRDKQGIAASTVNRNDLVAASAVFSFATTRDGKRLRTDNPIDGVKLVVPKTTRIRAPFFKPDEVSAILALARSATSRRGYPKASASRRWVPWICAYSGARVQEPLWLEKKHVRRDEETGIPVMDFQKTKTGNARCVPLHEALIEEGFLDFVASAPDGLLFVGDKPPKVVNDTRTIQEQRASSLAEWIQSHLDLEDGVDPNHGWRHGFITRATGKMEKRFANAICGHNENQDVSDRYFTAMIAEKKAALDCFPRYLI